MSTIEFTEALMDIETNLKSFALGFTRNQEDAKDLTQDTMLKAINYKSYYTPQTNFKAWVFTIMRNIFINQYRRKVKSRTIFDNSKELYLITNSKGHEQSAVSQIATQDIEDKIDSLSNEYKAPFKLHFSGFKYKEIADRLEIPIGTVKSRIFIARKKLIDLLPDYNYVLN
ncbi:MAG: RNA polymerase sigma factor [Crocinitomicaceae bacterium]|tara:strand:- start:10811 stop:11323 length:513 start_codon:yes stop_codon:yes gene_type:complete